MKFQVFMALAILISFANGYKILFMSPLNGKSHWLYMTSFVKALIVRGHEVTFLTSNSLKHLNLPNYTEVLVDPPFKVVSGTQDDFINRASGSFFSTVNTLRDLSKTCNTYNLANEHVEKFIHSEGLHFDLVINEEFFGDSQTLPFSDNMTFFEKWLNLIVNAYDWGVRQLQYLPTENELAKKHFGHLAPLPSINELHKNVSLVLVNSHRALSPPRPSMPNVISIGGAHIKPAKPLPKDIETFLVESQHGVIYFSLGTVLQSSKLPKEKLEAFFDTFKSLKQRVLWKFEDESLENVPSNVMIKKWMPQNDILAHPNVVLFISHGGLFGTSESLYHGVPLLLIPFFGDQHRNAHRIQTAGYGKFMSFQEINKVSFTMAVNELLSNEVYLTKAKQTSAVFKDNIVNPMDEAMFWIEHVCKFKGAKHLKSHAVNMSWFSYLLLDVIIANIVVFATVVLVQYKIIRSLCLRKKHVVKPGKKQE